MEEINKVYNPKIEKKKKKHWYRGRGIYNMLYNTTLYCMTHFESSCGKPQSSLLTSGPKTYMLDRRSEALVTKHLWS
jgi:hypothetical protein